VLDFLKFDTSVIVVFVAIVIVALLFAYLGSRYKVAGANEALIRSGRATPLGGGEAGLKVVRGQGIVVLPLFHKIGKLKLTARQINVNLADAVSRQGIKVAVQGVATFKIGADDESIRNAAERFLEAPEDQVDSIVKNVLEGSLRSIVGTLTIEELNLDRQKFQQAVQEAAKGDLSTSGLQIDSFTIQAIRDESGYMDLIGQQETARRERDARMAKATADQEAAVREAEAEQIKINAQRDVSLRKAETETQIAAAEARAAQAGPLAQAEATQEVTRKQTELAELAAARTQKELLTSTVRPAEAEADAQVKRAEGEKLARIAAAQADAERVKLAGQAEAAITITKGEANARVILVNAQSEAEKTKLEGNAEAGIVFTKGESEAKALALRAEAYRQFNEAAIIQTVLSMLPEIVRAAAEPMASIGSLTVLSSEGASDVVKNATRTVAEASTVVKGLTGLDVPDLISSTIRGGGSSGPGGRSGGGGTGGGGGEGGGTGRRRSTRPSGPAPRPAPAGAAGAAPDYGTAAVDAAATGELRSAGGAVAEAAGAGQRVAETAAEAAARQAAEGRAAIAEGEAATRAAMERVDDTVRRAAQTAGATLRGAPGAAESALRSAPAAAGVSRDTTVNVAAQRLARDLASIPGIERFGSLRLAELDRAGPRPLRTMWRIARGQLADRYGEMTIGEIVDRFGGGSGPTTRA
jgi:flotillin